MVERGLEGRLERSEHSEHFEHSFGEKVRLVRLVRLAYVECSPVDSGEYLEREIPQVLRVESV